MLLRVYEIDTPQIVSKLVLTTNNQNKISSRDLHANDEIQLDMERGFLQYGLYYERKPRQYDGDDKATSDLIMPNEAVAQAYLAVVLRKSSDARRRKYKIWGDLYDVVFAGAHDIERYIISVLISRITDSYLKASKHATSSNDIERKLANNGTYHVARLVVGIWYGHEWPASSEASKKVDLLRHSPSEAHAEIEIAFMRLLEIVSHNERFFGDVDNALKSSILDQEIEKRISIARQEVHEVRFPREGQSVELVEAETAENSDTIDGTTDQNLIDEKRSQIIAAVTRLSAVEYQRRTRSQYWDKSRAKRLVCTISKRYTRKGTLPYWYAYHPLWDAFLAEGESNSVILGCMDLDIAFQIPLEIIRNHLDQFHTTLDGNAIDYWHLKIAEPTRHEYALQLPKSGKLLPLQEYTISLIPA